MNIDCPASIGWPSTFQYQDPANFLILLAGGQSFTTQDFMKL
jgi:hypothetical protein